MGWESDKGFSYTSDFGGVCLVSFFHCPSHLLASVLNPYPTHFSSPSFLATAPKAPLKNRRIKIHPSVRPSVRQFTRPPLRPYILPTPPQKGSEAFIYYSRKFFKNDEAISGYCCTLKKKKRKLCRTEHNLSQLGSENRSLKMSAFIDKEEENRYDKQNKNQGHIKVPVYQTTCINISELSII